jgi:hypothetical protein
MPCTPIFMIEFIAGIMRLWAQITSQRSCKLLTV